MLIMKLFDMSFFVRQVRTHRSGCPLITRCGGSFSQEKPGVTVSFVDYK